MVNNPLTFEFVKIGQIKTKQPLGDNMIVAVYTTIICSNGEMGLWGKDDGASILADEAVWGLIFSYE